ncbi:MAG TPA: glutathione S-transferase [Rhodobiaceae bacterium]|nr:glutathione S-transferase [Rhodobiaceae bacterium]
MTAVELMGAPGSPYTRKMLALMRYRRIPYQISWQSFTSPGNITHKDRPQPKVPLLPTYYLLDDNGETQAVTDSTPILRRFETEFDGRSVIPSDPVLAFLNWLLEDYGDEWLTKSMFHYRWHYEADIKKAGSILPRWSNLSASDADIVPLSKYVSDRQIARLTYVGSNEVTKETIENSFKRFLNLLNEHLQTMPYIFGQRPSSADFAIYGQLTCLALFDPTPNAIIAGDFPRIYAWVELLEDLSGLAVADDDSGWLDTADLPETLRPLIIELATLYIPYLKLNAAAVLNGAELVDGEVDGRPYQQNPFPYQAKCLQWIGEQYAALSDADKARLAALTADTGLAEALS